MRVRDLNWFQLEEYLRSDDRIVLPIGSTEQHAYLSLETDNILAERVAGEAAEPIGVPVLPVLAYGLTPSFGAYPGSPTLRVRTLVAVVRDLLDSLHAQGFRRILIVNGHGGNVSADAVRREWGAGHPDAEVLFHNWWLGPAVWPLVQELDPGASHASWMENFPWTRLPGVDLPAKRKEPLAQPLPAAAAAMRDLAGDGQYGGFYELPDEDVLRIWAAVSRRHAHSSTTAGASSSRDLWSRELGNGTTRGRERGLARAPCCLVSACLDGSGASCARARRRPARAQFGLRLSPAAAKS